ncbi:MAG: ribbon-helix-helix domain-containing protein [Verrucomicrobiota bacterium]
MAEPRKSFLLRINPELWNELEGWSQEEFRSVNGQIEFLLQQAVRERRKGRTPSAPQPSVEGGKDAEPQV